MVSNIKYREKKTTGLTKTEPKFLFLYCIRIIRRPLMKQKPFVVTTLREERIDCGRFVTISSRLKAVVR